MREEAVDDVFAVSLPEGVDVEDPALTAELYGWVGRLVWAQYQGRRPHEIRIDVDWLITASAEEADAFQPAHDCPSCLAGTDQVRAFLRDNPGRCVALGNLHYVEVWDE